MSLRPVYWILAVAIGIDWSGVATAEQPVGTISVITYNIRYANPGDGLDVWANRVDAVANLVSRGDIVGMQEVTDPQLQDLRQRLSGYQYYGVGRDDGKRGGEYSPIFYRAERFELLDTGTFWLSDSPDQIGSRGWDAALPRICSWIRVRDRQTDQRLWIANSHFDHRGSRARQESGKLIVEMVAKLSAGDPVVVMGDFNCVAGTDPYQSLVAPTAQVPLTDARQQTEPLGPQSTWNGFREIVPDRIIDHLFVNDRIEVKLLETLDPKTAANRFASDHLPVLVRVDAVSTPSESGE